MGLKGSKLNVAYEKFSAKAGVLIIIIMCLAAPSIYENEDIKKGILCQLFGGANKDFTDTGRGKFRFVNWCKR